MAKKLVKRSGSRLDERPTAVRTLDAAAELFFRQGYTKTSVQDVANAVGILKGSLYYYIDSKDDLLARLIEDTQESNLAIVDEIETMNELRPLERLRLYLERQVVFNARNIERITVYYRDMEYLPAERRKKLLAGRRRFTDFVTNLINEARDAGDVDPEASARLLTFCAFATTNWMYRWYKPQGPVGPDDMAKVFAEFVIAGITGSRAVSDIPDPKLDGAAPAARRRESSKKSRSTKR
jgi:TetR/AcrR family transcriptional regulator, cholesterol catabolism regulator